MTASLNSHISNVIINSSKEERFRFIEILSILNEKGGPGSGPRPHGGWEGESESTSRAAQRESYAAHGATKKAYPADHPIRQVSTQAKMYADDARQLEKSGSFKDAAEMHSFAEAAHLKVQKQAKADGFEEVSFLHGSAAELHSSAAMEALDRA